MSAKRARSAVEACDRSVHPNLAGVPWWAALLTAVGVTAIGFAIDAGNHGLTHVFAGFYIAGCLLAVLVVRRKDLFTAVIQPPLILFCAVPGAYWLFHGGKFGHLKDLLINCGYPLIERFPLMLGAAGAVLLIGMVRWYLDAPSRTTLIAAKLNSMLGIDSPEDDAAEATAAGAGRTGATPREAASRTGRATRNRRSTTRTGRQSPERERVERERVERGRVERGRVERGRVGRGRVERELVERELVERAKRRRRAASRDVNPAEPPRRSRRRPHPPQETPRDSRARRNIYELYERPAPHHGGRLDGSEFLFSDLYADMSPPPRAAKHESSPQHDKAPVNRYPPYQPHAPYQPYAPLESYAPYDPPRRQRASGGPTTNPTHQPISRVRYRRSAAANDPDPRDVG